MIGKSGNLGNVGRINKLERASFQIMTERNNAI